MLNWAKEPLTTWRRFGFDVAVFILVGLIAGLWFGIDWTVIPVLVAGRLAVTVFSRIREGASRPEAGTGKSW